MLFKTSSIFMFVITLFVDTNVTLFLYVYTNVLNLTVISHLKGLNKVIKKP
ncbi:hypothetical protein FLAVO9R_30399 [Flavobacterium sp. 9R]|nr:hypothetical protein FLAVO9R_30399 [Flavobacterium sp. 9R]